MKQIFEIECNDFDITKELIERLLRDHIYKAVGPQSATPFPGYFLEVTNITNRVRG